jgi:hypothetical protein
MKKLLSLILFLALATADVESSDLAVSKSKRYLVDRDGKPFFWLGDTAWELFHRLDREEATLYLENRAKKGFTVIQAVVLAERNGLTEPNPYGHLPLQNRNPLQPVEEYFEHVDYIVNKAEALGLVIGLLPTWGSYWSENNPDHKIFDEQNANWFGEYVGKRYREKPIIWILGGDHNIRTTAERRIVEAMARGLKKGDGDSHLMTFHPRGPGFSSDYWKEADWLDFNMYQSSHAAHDHDNGLFAEHDYALSPVKPTLDGEPRYEGLTAGFYFYGADPNDRFDDDDARQAAYWSILAGACGHTYGHNSIWQMYTPEKSGVLWAAVPWQAALDHPGAYQMGILRRLFETLPFFKLVPAQAIIKDGPITGGAKIRAAAANDSSFVIIYSPRGEPFTVDKSVIKAKKMKEMWFDPRYGIVGPIHDPDTAGIQTYTPPTRGPGKDWILIIRDAGSNMPWPGYSY